MESRIILLRHGLTEGNQRRWFYGGIDIPLTEEGRQQLKERREAGVYPPVPEDAQVFTSGLIRTEETLELTYGPRPHGRIPELREYRFGRFEARNYDELSKAGGRELEIFNRWAYDETGEVALPGGESRSEFRERSRQGVERLLEAHRAYGKKRRESGMPVTLMVCHGGVISQMLLTMFGHLEGTMWDYIPAPGLGYVVSLTKGEPRAFEPIEDSEAASGKKGK